MNILYIEDNIQDLNLVKRYIDTTHHHLIMARNAAEVDLEAAPIDLVLLDIVLEGKTSGFDCLDIIRNNGIDCPVIAVTALSQPNQIRGYKDAGMNAVISKPFEITELVQLIARYESQ